jgi:hypothetical protein
VPDGDCVANVFTTWFVNTVLDERAEIEAGNTPTFHCGDIHITNGSAALLARLANNTR